MVEAEHFLSLACEGSCDPHLSFQPKSTASKCDREIHTIDFKKNTRHEKHSRNNFIALLTQEQCGATNAHNRWHCGTEVPYSQEMGGVCWVPALCRDTSIVSLRVDANNQQGAINRGEQEAEEEPFRVWKAENSGEAGTFREQTEGRISSELGTAEQDGSEVVVGFR